MGAKETTQFKLAQRMYTKRASDYDSSWHAEYSKRFIKVASIKQNDHILDLACGTGLDALEAASLVGDNGRVICVDATESMLEAFQQKLHQNTTLARLIKLFQHDVTDLSTCKEIERGSFDLILCSNAFVLFAGDAAKVVRDWSEYLKVGGRMVIDIPHQLSFRQGNLLETVFDRLGIPFPSKRLWVKSIDSFKGILEHEGLVVEHIETVDDVSGKGHVFADGTSLQADEMFDSSMKVIPSPQGMSLEELAARAKPLFREEWEKAAVDGKVEIYDTLYIYVAAKKK
ncbi:methyltransferase [Pochonia chlamydosporia 170]|uniref:Methyltransferase n=1 Tax=Pochonia chlamydosporia 170 TaxID=1380566 RepID=A0A179F3C0_METCM|nr:methyltransferase [Pochonia chlamydosporia 170]OAQ59851.1 methyltransferase [Pochonia chlamydosporia 170]